jgi:lysophospholipase L1-like esterase
MRRFSGIRCAAAVSALACVLALAPALPASATGTGSSNPSTYLALGDSVPFGFNPLLVRPGVNPRRFVGYPQLAAGLFRPRLKVFNASCPGETSTSLITGTLPDNGCQGFRSIAALHVSYQGSQLQYAESFVAAHPRTRFVSLMIGANDLFRLQDTCVATVPPAGVNVCIGAGLPGLLATVQSNIVTIYASLRAAGYRGDFVAVTYYSTDYADPVVTGAVNALDQVLAGVTLSFGGKVADGFGAFERATAPFRGNTCAAGLLIHLTPTTCDVHPSRAGAALLALTLRKAEGPTGTDPPDQH